MYVKRASDKGARARREDSWDARGGLGLENFAISKLRVPAPPLEISGRFWGAAFAAAPVSKEPHHPTTTHAPTRLAADWTAADA